MSETRAAEPSGAGYVTVRYWASARAAAGTTADRLEVAGGLSLAEVTAAVLDLRAGQPGRDRLAAVLAACSVLVDEDPVGTREHASVVVHPGQGVEFLPPFAGG